ncbi:MAG: FKBP-type peptidyl-prolyl cis-trans isomerase, partial [Patescibacteria group bacterium]
RLTIPAALAYGDRATGNIPANSDLVFDIELKEVK